MSRTLRPLLRWVVVGLSVGFIAGCLEPLVKVVTDAGAGITCNEGLTLCAEQCVDLFIDQAHCGTCTTTCTSTQTCTRGTCTASASCAGVTCPAGQSCVGGTCVAGCIAGSACTPSVACATGISSCDGGMTCVPSGSVAAGTACGTDKVCSPQGSCVDCAAGVACDAGVCFVGSVACATGASQCQATGVRAPGSVCGAALVCAPDAGCVACNSGAGCDAGACLLGSFACGSGAPVCQSMGLAPVGTQCDTASFCTFDGRCQACTVGAVCSPSTGPCFTGSLACADGGAQCTVSGVRAPGATCGSNQVCAPDAGCINCQVGATCDAGACRISATVCSTGAEVCTSSGNVPLGVQVTPAAVCDGDGGLVSCALNTGCDAGACLIASTACSSGSPVCTVVARVDAGVQVGASSFCDGDGGIGACTPGVACNTANSCENGVIDCSTGASRCVPASGAGQFKAASTVCRMSTGVCDPAENCTGSSATCPADQLSSPSTQCRAAGADATCDPAELCTGTSAACPVNAVAASGASCGSPDATGCNAPDTCDGAGACVARFKSTSVQCRAAGADSTCDPAEFCTGASVSCPADAFASTLVACGSQSSLDCDAPDTCSGSGTCVNRVKASSVQCRASSGNATCDPPESCDGVTATCPADFIRGAGFACSTANGAGTCTSTGTCVTSPAFVYNGLCGTNPQVASNGTEFNCGPTGPFPLNFPTCSGAPCSLGDRCVAGTSSDPYRDIYACIPGGQVWVSKGVGVGQCGYPSTQSCASVTDQACSSVSFAAAGSACTTLNSTCAAITSYQVAADGTLTACGAGPCFTKGRLFVCVIR